MAQRYHREGLPNCEPYATVVRESFYWVEHSPSGDYVPGARFRREEVYEGLGRENFVEGTLLRSNGRMWRVTGRTLEDAGAVSVVGRKLPMVLKSLVCRQCGHVLCDVVEVKGRTALRAVVSGQGRSSLVVKRAEIVCAVCGAVREFHATPISGVRLGLDADQA